MYGYAWVAAAETGTQPYRIHQESNFSPSFHAGDIPPLAVPQRAKFSSFYLYHFPQADSIVTFYEVVNFHLLKNNIARA